MEGNENSNTQQATQDEAAAAAAAAEAAKASAAAPSGKAKKDKAPELSQAFADVLAERLRQVKEEGHSAERDDLAGVSDLAAAASCYAVSAAGLPRHKATFRWPFEVAMKPGDTRRDLVKSIALGLAALECYDRQAAAAE